MAAELLDTGRAISFKPVDEETAQMERLDEMIPAIPSDLPTPGSPAGSAR